jgi:hypothetical protein
MTSTVVLAARFLFAPEACFTKATKALPPIKGGGAPKGARVVAALALPKRRAACVCAYRGARPLSGDTLAFRRSTAALAKTSRSWLSPVPRFMVADTRSAPRAASSWQTGVCRPGEFPNRPRMKLRAPSRAPLPLASIGRHRLTSLGRARCALLVRRAARIQEIPPGRVISLIWRESFFALCLMAGATIVTAGLIRTFSTPTRGNCRHFRIVATLICGRCRMG